MKIRRAFLFSHNAQNVLFSTTAIVENKTKKK